MIRKIFVAAILVSMVFMIYPVVSDFKPFDKLNPLAEKYVKDGPGELGVPNLVTSIVVTYRGLDTLGEVTVLFIATAGVGFLLAARKEQESVLPCLEKKNASEFVDTGSRFLIPFIILFGIYIFVHGHLTPGGGFQGGVVIATAFLMGLLSDTSYKINGIILELVESLSGAGFVAVAILGLVLAGGFLDNRFLPLGEYGRLFSGGAIAVIYSLIGLKVGSELTAILKTMSRSGE